MMTADPFAYLAKSLAAIDPAAAQARAELMALRPTDRVRHLLAIGGLQGSRELGAAASIDPRIVSGLLKADLRDGRVARKVLRDGRQGYQLVADYDEKARAAIVAAIKLLKRNGYRVTKPRV